MSITVFEWLIVCNPTLFLHQYRHHGTLWKNYWLFIEISLHPHLCSLYKSVKISHPLELAITSPLHLAQSHIFLEHWSCIFGITSFLGSLFFSVHLLRPVLASKFLYAVSMCYWLRIGDLATLFSFLCILSALASALATLNSMDLSWFVWAIQLSCDTASIAGHFPCLSHPKSLILSLGKTFLLWIASEVWS